MFGEQNVAGVTAFHRAVREIQTSASEVRLTSYIHHSADRSTVNAHAQAQTWVIFKCTAQLDRAANRCFRTGVKDQRHAVTGGDLDQALRRVGLLKLVGRANDLGQLVDDRVLLVTRKPRIANDIDEQNMCDLQLDLFLNFSRHDYFEVPDASFWKRGSFRSGSNIGSSLSSAGVSSTFTSAPSYGIDSSFCKAAMARSGSPICAATRARISIGLGPFLASFSIGIAAMARSDRANAAALSPRPILASARSPM